MALLTKDTDYAMRALIHFARHPETTLTTREVSEKLGLSRPFLRKILQRLRRAGLLGSTKGKGGGFIMPKKTKRIPILELVRLFQGEADILHCSAPSGLCANAPGCAVHRKLTLLHRQFERDMALLDIGTLAASRR
jgi:Rrf2 family protein